MGTRTARASREILYSTLPPLQAGDVLSEPVRRLGDGPEKLETVFEELLRLLR